MILKRITALFCALTMGVTMTACSPKIKPVKSPDDFDGAKIAVQSSTTSSALINEMKNTMKIDVSEYDSISKCFDKLKKGKVDAVYVDSVVAAYYTDKSEDYKQAWISDEEEPLGICMRKDSEELAEAVNAALDVLFFEGSMDIIGRKYFGEDYIPARNVEGLKTFPDYSVPNGVFKVGVQMGYPPMEYEKDGQYTGFDIEIATEIATLLNGEVEFVTVSQKDIYNKLDSGEYDAIISSVSITPERQEKYLFSEPYAANAQSIVVLI
ncbi:MAG: transporter substrate-binding domain-containing protein [Oscillospiraceae bacterium]|jgi:ABC-type amino acid transport substrate-binding protein|nr:transporter substrate-binding domain-containing protein [Oscillospiraceae bacterium]